MESELSTSLVTVSVYSGNFLWSSGEVIFFLFMIQVFLSCQGVPIIHGHHLSLAFVLGISHLHGHLIRTLAQVQVVYMTEIFMLNDSLKVPKRISMSISWKMQD